MKTLKLTITAIKVFIKQSFIYILLILILPTNALKDLLTIIIEKGEEYEEN